MSYPLPQKPEKPAKPPRKGVRRFLRVLFWLGFISFIFLMMFLTALSSVSGNGDRQKSLVESIFSALSGQAVHVGKLHQFSLSPDVEYNFEDLRTGGDANGFAIQNFHTRMSLWSLITSDPLIKVLNVQGFQLPAKTFFDDAFVLSDVSIDPKNIHTPAIRFAGKIGSQKIKGEIGLNIFMDAMNQPYYKLGKEVPVHIVVGDLDMKAILVRGSDTKLKDITIYRQSKPDDRVTGQAIIQISEKLWQVEGDLLTAKSDTKASFDFDLGEHQVKPQGLIVSKQIDWDEYYGSSTLSVLRQFLSQFAVTDQMRLTFKIDPDLTFICDKADKTLIPPEKLNEKVIQHCFR